MYSSSFFHLSSMHYLINYCLIVEWTSNNAIKIISKYVFDLRARALARTCVCVCVHARVNYPIKSKCQFNVKKL